MEHAIRAACDVAEDTEVYVFGSSAILGQYADAPDSLRRSIEADIAPKNRPENVDLIDGSLGELSMFHEMYGFFVHGVPIETAILPPDWEHRAIPLVNENTRSNIGWCVEVHDLAASKLAAFRDKDRDFVRVLLQGDVIDADRLHELVSHLHIDEALRTRVLSWVRATVRR